MLRSANSAAARVVGARTIVGVAPVLHLASPKPALSKEEQVKKNTAIALDMIRRFKGDSPKAYTRRHSKSFAEIEKEIEVLLGGAEKMRKKVTDEQPMDKLSVMERTLRHAVWQYLKDEGKYDFGMMEKWLVYTETDSQRLGLLKRDADLKGKYAAYKAKKEGAACVPKFNWEKEYSQVIDREIVAEKRIRYETVAANTTERADNQVAEVLASYRKPIQEERLDKMVDLLERFKPMLAREAIIQRLTIKHLEGQLGVWRYMDWMPEVRDRAELESDNYCHHWWLETEEKRLLAVRLRSKKEVAEIMSGKQAEAMAAQAKSSSSSAATGDAKQAARQKLLQEVLALQARAAARREEKA